MSSVIETSIQLSRPIRCPVCEWPVKYVDRLDSGELCCIACTFIQGYSVESGAIHHEMSFSPEDPYFLSAMLRVSAFSINADPRDGSKKTAEVKTKLSRKTLEGIATLAKNHQVPPNVEMETALSWYLAAVRGKQAQQKVENRLGELEEFIPENTAKAPPAVRAHSWKNNIPAFDVAGQPTSLEEEEEEVWSGHGPNSR